MQMVGTVVGGVIGGTFGPVGAAIGAGIGGAIGGYVDQTILFPPDNIKAVGPRLDNLKTQVSAYGEFIPKIWGRVRVAGNMIWATDIIEVVEKETDKGGKGEPDITTTTYSYFANCAIGVCEGPRTITKIWADSKLIYDIYGSLGSDIVHSEIGRGTWRQFWGTEEQTAPSMLYSDTGSAAAYRGLCYILFEMFPLEQFGNRIPSFNFEVVSDFLLEDTAFDIEGYSTTQFILDPYDPMFMFAQSGGHGYMRINVVTGKMVTHNDTRVPHLGGTEQFDIDSKGFIYSILADSPNSAYPVKFSKYGLLASTASAIAPSPPGLINTNCIRVIKNEDRPYAIWWNSLGSGGVYIGYSSPDAANQVGLIDGIIGQFGNGGDDNIQPRQVAIDHENGRAWALWSRYNSSHGITKIQAITFSGDRTVNESDTDITAVVWSANFMMYSRETNELVIGGPGPLSNSDDIRLLFFDADSLTLNDTMLLNFYGVPNQWINAENAQDGYLWLDMGLTSVVQVDISAREVVDEHTFIGVPGLGTTHTAVYNPIIEGVITVSGGFKKLLFRGNNDPAALSNVVSEICLEVGLTADEIDVTELESDIVTGFQINQQVGARGAIEALMGKYFFDCQEVDGKLRFIKRINGTTSATISEGELATHMDGTGRPNLLTIARKQDTELPNTVEIAYPDSDRAHELGLQRARRQIKESQNILRKSVPVLMTASAAKQLAEITLYAAWLQRNTYQISLPTKYVKLTPCDLITVTRGAYTYLLRIDKIEIARGVLALDCSPEDTAVYSSNAVGDSGYIYVNPIPVRGTSRMEMLDIPILNELNNKAGIYFGVAGYASDWRGAMIYKSPDGESDWGTFAAKSQAAEFGIVDEALPAGKQGVFNYEYAITVLMESAETTLATVTELDVLNQKNVCLIGNEIVQFTTAIETPADSNIWVLGGILRGRKGTDHEMENHSAGERFILLTETGIGFRELPVSELNQKLYFKCASIGGDWASGNLQIITPALKTLKPYSPIHFEAENQTNEDVIFNWLRRGRLNHEWKDLQDTPIGETTEAYQVDILDSTETTVIRSIPAIEETITYTAAEQETDTSIGAFVFGSQTGTGLKSVSKNYIHLSQFTLAETTSIKALSFNSYNPDPRNRITLVIYDSKAGTLYPVGGPVYDDEPDNLIVAAPEVIPYDGINFSVLPSAVELPAGDYFIGTMAGIYNGIWILELQFTGVNWNQQLATADYEQGPDDPIIITGANRRQNDLGRYAAYSAIAEDHKAVVYQLSAEIGKGFPSKIITFK